MKKIEIYEFQLKVIEDALRLTANIHDSRDGKTAFDRGVRQAEQYAKNALKGDIDKTVSYITGK